MSLPSFFVDRTNGLRIAQLGFEMFGGAPPVNSQAFGSRKLTQSILLMRLWGDHSAAPTQAGTVTAAGEILSIAAVFLIKGKDPNLLNANAQVQDVPADPTFGPGDYADTNANGSTGALGGPQPCILSHEVKGWIAPASSLAINEPFHIDFGPEGLYLEEGTNLGVYLDAYAYYTGTAKLNAEVQLLLGYYPAKRPKTAKVGVGY